MTRWPTVVRDPGLDDAERGGHGGDGDHADDQPDQQRQVAAAGSASSMTARSRNGEAIATPTDDATMIAVTTASGRRCGANRRADAAQRDLAGLRLLGAAVTVGRRARPAWVSLSKEHSLRCHWDRLLRLPHHEATTAFLLPYSRDRTGRERAGGVAAAESLAELVPGGRPPAAAPDPGGAGAVGRHARRRPGRSACSPGTAPSGSARCPSTCASRRGRPPRSSTPWRSAGSSSAAPTRPTGAPPWSRSTAAGERGGRGASGRPGRAEAEEFFARLDDADRADAHPDPAPPCSPDRPHPRPRG